MPNTMEEPKVITLSNGDVITFKLASDPSINSTGFLIRLMNIDGLLDRSKLGNLFQLFPFLVDNILLGSGLKATPTMDYLERLPASDGSMIMGILADHFLKVQKGVN